MHSHIVFDRIYARECICVHDFEFLSGDFFNIAILFAASKFT